MSVKNVVATALTISILGACADANTPTTPSAALAPEAVSSNTGVAATFTVQDLGTLPGGTNSAGYAINNAGDVVGSSELGGGRSHPALWAVGKPPKDLGLPWGTFAAAYGINDAQTIVGYAAAGVTTVGWVWKKGTYTIVKPGTSSPYVSLVAINNSEVAVGWFRNVNPQQLHAFKYTLTGGVVDLHPGPNYKESVAYSINDQGVVVGSVKLLNGDRHVAMWSASGQFTDLGTLGGTYGEAAAVNALGQVVGISSKSGRQMPFYWASGSMSSMGSVGEVSGISDKGRIVGSYNGKALTRRNVGSGVVTLPGLPVSWGGNGLAYAVNKCGSVTGMTSTAFRIYHAARWVNNPCD
jgi:probable HAF family extracellular repeat protein